jgi:4'-phosphopantetheinyl transferase
MVSCRQVEWDRSLIGPDLPVGDVHLWLANVDGGANETDVLSSAERERAAKFRFDHHRRRWAAARVLLRLVLGRYLATGPESVVLELGDHGRTVVRWPGDSEWLSFSPSRSGDLALVGVAREQRIGVDLERIRPDLEFVAIARRALGDEVADHLEVERDEKRAGEFFRAWVREEARGKCRGTGLVEPEDEARHIPLLVTDLAIRDGYAGALAIDGKLGMVRGCLVDV